MGSVTRRLRALEERSRERATAEIRRAWEDLPDEEMALILAPFHFGREPQPEEAAAEKVFREIVPEALIAHAIGFSEHLDEAEATRRLEELLAPVLRNRRDRVLRHITEAS